MSANEEPTFDSIGSDRPIFSEGDEYPIFEALSEEPCVRGSVADVARLGAMALCEAIHELTRSIDAASHPLRGSKR